MNYKGIYDRLVKRGKSRRTKTVGWGAWHRHHIVPRHVGGSNDSTNLTKLQVKEHRLAHLLLYKIYGRWEDELAYKMLRGVIKDVWECPKYRERMSKVVAQNLSNVDRVKAGRLAGIAARRTLHLTLCNPEVRNKAVVALREWVALNPTKAAAKASVMHTDAAVSNMARSRSKYIVIAPDGVEYLSTRDAAEATGHGSKNITNWIIRGHYGWSRRLKTL